MHVCKARLRHGWHGEARMLVVLAGCRRNNVHLSHVSSGADHVGGSGGLVLSGHGCNGRDWRSGHSNSHCRHKADELFMRAADVRGFTLQRGKLSLLLLMLMLLRLVWTSILGLKLVLHSFGLLDHLLDLVNAFIVAASSADRLQEIVEHSPRPSGDLAQEAFLP